jgi:predicted RNA binding protein YcfA (HicA-like mRNA interferase family)
MTFRDLEKIIKEDGWKRKNTTGSHHHYIHEEKPGKVTIPRHTGDVSPKVVSFIMKQAGLK